MVEMVLTVMVENPVILDAFKVHMDAVLAISELVVKVENVLTVVGENPVILDAFKVQIDAVFATKELVVSVENVESVDTVTVLMDEMISVDNALVQ